MRSYHDRRERQAQDLQAQAYQLYRSAVEQEDEVASKDLLSKAQDRFEEVIEEFDGTHAANMARIYRGHASFALGRYEDAIEDYEGAHERISLPEMKALALQGLGFSLMSEGEFERAIETFKKLGEMGGAGFQGTVQWNIARCYERQGKVQNAVEIYRELKQSSPDHMRRMLAEAKLAQLAGE
jgi:tetratricopeptide (TPR) repeat protein